MPRGWVWIVGALALGLAGGCAKTKAPAPLLVFCGSSMAGPAQEVGREFATAQRFEVRFDLGGSETLLPRLLTGAPADIFVCHDPFAAKLEEAKLAAGVVAVGWLRPVLLVRPGNPLKLAGLADLAREGLKVGIGDPRYSTCGELFVAELERQKLKDAVMRNVVLQGRTHAEIANGLVLGPLDAVVVWNFIAPEYGAKVQEVPTPDTYPETRVTVVGLAKAPNPAARDAFLEKCREPAVRELFAKHGYGRGGLPPPPAPAP